MHIERTIMFDENFVLYLQAVLLDKSDKICQGDENFVP